MLVLIWRGAVMGVLLGLLCVLYLHGGLATKDDIEAVRDQVRSVAEMSGRNDSTIVAGIAARDSATVQFLRRFGK